MVCEGLTVTDVPLIFPGCHRYVSAPLPDKIAVCPWQIIEGAGTEVISTVGVASIVIFMVNTTAH